VVRVSEQLYPLNHGLIQVTEQIPVYSKILLRDSTGIHRFSWIKSHFWVILSEQTLPIAELFNIKNCGIVDLFNNLVSNLGLSARQVLRFCELKLHKTAIFIRSCLEASISEQLQYNIGRRILWKRQTFFTSICRLFLKYRI
jgi:hypothetical protein